MKISSYIYEHHGIHTRLQAYGEGILRITRTRRKEFLDKPSDAVVLQTPILGELTETNLEARFTTGSVTAVINKDSGALRFVDTQGHVLLREPDRRPFLLVEKPVYLHRYDRNTKVTESASVDGARASAEAAEVYLDRTAYECKQNFLFDAEWDMSAALRCTILPIPSVS